MIDLNKYTIEELIKIKDLIEGHIRSYSDGYLYICRVHSYGRSRTENIQNAILAQELCYQYSGDDGIVNVYSTNPELSIDNYGDVMYIESKRDYDIWNKCERIKETIDKIEKELDEWDNREKLAFRDRPVFGPTNTRDELEAMKAELSNYFLNNTYIPPKKFYSV